MSKRLIVILLVAAVGAVGLILYFDEHTSSRWNVQKAHVTKVWVQNNRLVLHIEAQIDTGSRQNENARKGHVQILVGEPWKPCGYCRVWEEGDMDDNHNFEVDMSIDSNYLPSKYEQVSISEWEVKLLPEQEVVYQNLLKNGWGAVQIKFLDSGHVLTVPFNYWAGNRLP